MYKQWTIAMPAVLLAVGMLALASGCEPHEPMHEMHHHPPPPAEQHEWPEPEHHPEHHEPSQDPGPVFPEHDDTQQHDEPDHIETVPWPAE